MPPVWLVTPLIPEAADIRPILRDAVEAMETHALQVGLTLAADLPEHLPFLPIHSSDMEAIVIKLLDNAIKYTPAGGKIDLRAWAENGRCLIRVEDTGLGIPDEDLPHIFERFYQVDKACSRGTVARGRGSGAGLGLSIVKAIVEEYGGTVTVDSVPGQGTAFVVAFPVTAKN